MKLGVFILSHGRPDCIYTINTLRSQGYTGDYKIIIDSDDTTRDEYIRQFGEDKIVIFDKSEVEKKFDIMDNFNNRNVVVYARNVCFDIAKELCWEYFLEFEDDYVRFEVRWEDNHRLMTYKIQDLDKVFDYMIDYLEESNALTIAFSQGGDLIGGTNSNMWKKQVKRKAMNTFFCKTSKPFTFIGRMNDDVCTYTTQGSVGKLFLTIANIDIVQVPTQKNSGGNSEAYLEYGTYLKSFYSVMCMPSCVKISEMGTTSRRVHHTIEWDNCVPMIISERFRNG